MIGTTLDGKYLIRSQIGQGGMGAVYEAEIVGNGTRVAVKVIRSPEVAKNDILISRFQREAKLAGSIDTEHIGRVIDASTDPETGLPYMVMELLTGEDANQVIKRIGPLAGHVALRIVAQACAGLQKAHEARVVHRDVKSANLFLARDDRDPERIVVKVLDFGVAKVRRDDSDISETAGLTRTGSVLGSPLFMAPEQARGAKVVDERADVWSLGIVLYHLLSGRTPFHDITALGELILALCSAPPPPVTKFAPWVRPEVAELVEMILRIDPDQRIQSAKALRAAILPLVGGDDAVRATMLLPLAEDERSYAPAHSMPGGLAGTRTPVSVQLDASPHAETEAATGSSEPGVVQTSHNVSKPLGSMPPRPARRGPFIAVVGVATLAGAGLAFALTKVSAPASKTTEPVASVVGSPVVADPPPSASVPAKASIEPTASSPEPVASAAPSVSAPQSSAAAKPKPKPKPTGPSGTEGFGDRK